MDQIAPKRSRGRPRKVTTDGEPTTVQALDRGLQLLSLLSKEQRATLTELALRVGMPPSSAHRLLMTLQHHGFAEFDENTQEWMIGIEAFRTGSAYLKRTGLMEASHDIMRNLMETTGETANLAIADSGDVVFISQVESHNPIRAFFRSGTRSHMHASGIGKALLAEMSQQEVEQLLQKKGLPEFTDKTLTKPDRLFDDLAQTRARGWSFDDEERYTGMRCVAAPVFNAYGEAVAGISVSGPTSRLSDQRVAEISAAVRQAAATLTERIGGWQQAKTG
ncbi:MAG: IclR family transcriptional regulator [Alphaproteobacteria bacterium]|nr:IclR family transcriptional regulator [Alphaproteobacteria bacterium]